MDIKKKYKVAVLIPIYNEKRNILKFIRKFNKNVFLLIVNDASTDGVAPYIDSLKIKTLINSRRIGYEKSLIKGLSYLIKKRFTHIITFDGDGQHSTQVIDRVLEKYKILENDLVVMNRDKFNRPIEYLISCLFYILYRIKDPLSGLKIYKVKSLKKLNINSCKNNYMVDLLIQSKFKKLKILNFPIIANKRKGSAKVGGMFKVNIKMLKIIFNIITSELNFKIFHNDRKKQLSSFSTLISLFFLLKIS